MLFAQHLIFSRIKNVADCFVIYGGGSWLSFQFFLEICCAKCIIINITNWTVNTYNNLVKLLFFFF